MTRRRVDRLERLSAAPARLVNGLGATLEGVVRRLEVPALSPLLQACAPGTFFEQVPDVSALASWVDRLDASKPEPPVPPAPPRGGGRPLLADEQRSARREREAPALGSLSERRRRVEQLLAREVGPTAVVALHDESKRPELSRRPPSVETPPGAPRREAPGWSAADASRRLRHRVRDPRDEAAFDRPLSAGPREPGNAPEAGLALSPAASDQHKPQSPYPLSRAEGLLRVALVRLGASPLAPPSAPPSGELGARSSEPRSSSPPLVRALDELVELGPRSAAGGSGLRRLAAAVDHAQSRGAGTPAVFDSEARPERRHVAAPSAASFARGGESLGAAEFPRSGSPLPVLEARLEEDALEQRLARILRREALRQGIDVEGGEPWR